MSASPFSIVIITTNNDMNAYELAYEYVQHTNRCIFLTGKAGTGKTTFLRRLKTETLKQMTVVAPTGVAAINAEGVTIHSLFQLPPQLFLPTPEARRKLFSEMQMRSHKQRVLRNLELLVVVWRSVSTASARSSAARRQFATISHSLRTIRAAM